MRKLAALGAAVVMVVAMAAPATAGKDKVWVCHATNSETNPWVLVHVANGWDEGHGNGGPALHQNVDFEVAAFPGIKAGPSEAQVCEGPGGPQ